MAEKTETNPLGAGRSKFVIDWEYVDQLLEAGCSLHEIAGYLGVHFETITNRMLSDGLIGPETPYPNFSEYKRSKFKKGNALLRDMQHKKALSGDKVMLIWLGKQRLNQSEKVENKNTGAVELQYKLGESLIKIATEPDHSENSTELDTDQEEA